MRRALIIFIVPLCPVVVSLGVHVSAEAGRGVTSSEGGTIVIRPLSRAFAQLIIILLIKMEQKGK